MRQVFTSITLLDGRQCDILDIDFGVISTAQFRMITQKNTEYDASFFIFHQILRIDKKQLSFDEVSSIGIDDYLKIAEVMGAILMRIPK